MKARAKHGMGIVVLVLSLAGVSLAAVESAMAQTVSPETRPPGETLSPTPLNIEVVGRIPVPGIGVDRDQIPSNVQSLPTPDSDKRGPAPLSTELDQRLGSVNVNANQDNPFQPDIQYRGFEASPILGTPIGVVAYQNGVRINEPFGDNLNWDLVPNFAINQTTIIPSNPVYGLNALGGALVLNMKDGFNFEGGEAEVSGGSFGRRQSTLQYGKQIGNVAAYIGVNAYNDEGFRKFSPSQVRQIYADIGAETDHVLVHLNFTGANNKLVGVGPTPIQLVDRDRSAVFTSPQKFDNTLVMPSLNADIIASDTLSFQGSFYLRSAGRKALNGNTTGAQPCVDPALLCLGDDATPLIDTHGAQVPASVLGGGIAGENDNSTINALGLGGSLQGAETHDILGYKNNLVMGLALDHADVDFNSTNELGTINPATLVVGGTGVIIDQPDGSLAPVALNTTNSYYGIYATDTFEVTPRLSLTVGGRYNLALIHLTDKVGTALNGESRYARLNPSAGATYKLLPSVTGYVGYAEANRAPTAGEIACSNPAKPCSLDNFLTSDPPGLRQVVARTYEVGLRGRFETGASGRIGWNLGLFRTDLSDDILNVPGSLIGSGFFANVGNTRRQGIEAGLSYRDDKWQVSANYSLVDATFQSPITLSAPSNPVADASGNVHVVPGDHLPGIPQHRLKLDADYAVTDAWSIGANFVAESGQYYFGDPSNQNAQLAGFFVIDLRSSYRVTENIELFGQIENLLDRRYATFGTFGDVTKVPLPGVPNPSDPRFISVAPPLAAYAGIRVRL